MQGKDFSVNLSQHLICDEVKILENPVYIFKRRNIAEILLYLLFSITFALPLLLGITGKNAEIVSFPFNLIFIVGMIVPLFLMRSMWKENINVYRNRFEFKDTEIRFQDIAYMYYDEKVETKRDEDGHVSKSVTKYIAFEQKQIAEPFRMQLSVFQNGEQLQTFVQHICESNPAIEIDTKVHRMKDGEYPHSKKGIYLMLFVFMFIDFQIFSVLQHVS